MTSAEKVTKRGKRFVGCFFGKVMPARHPVTGYVRSNLSPLGKDIVIVADESGLTPQGKKRHLQCCRPVFLVMFKISIK